MADSDKDILITPNTGQTEKPKIEVTGANDTKKTIEVNDDGSLTFNSTIAATSGSVADGNANLVTGDAVFDYIAAQNFQSAGQSNFSVGDITGQSELASGSLTSADEFVISDDGGVGTDVLKKISVSTLENYMQNNLTFTTDTNTFRTVTAGGNTLGASETLAFTAGSNVTITELDGAVTIASTDTNTQLTLLDEDDMSSNSATAAASQQSIKAYVDSEVAGLVDSAPSALDTLNELAAALGDDASFSTTTATSLGNRLRVDVNTQGLTSTQQGNALTNLGITASLAEINILDDGLAASDIPNLAASKITSGTFADARIAESNVTQHLAAGTGLDLSGKTFSVDVSDFMTNGANNRILTATGTDAFTAESNFTYDATEELATVDKLKAQIIIEVQNDTASSISKGEAVYVSGEGTHPSVTPARADASSTMPSIGIVTNSISASGSGYVTTNGVLTISSTVIDDTLSDPGDVGKTLYVSPTTAGNLTITKPTTSSHLIQNVGRIVDINGSNIKIAVSNIGRSNDVPNTISIAGSITGSSIVKSGGTSSQFLKADGSVDSSTYLTAPRTVTAGGNTLANGETLAFTAGSNVTITESGGAVTIASTDTNLSNAEVISALNSDLGGDIVFGTQTDDNVKYTGTISVGNVDAAGSAKITADGFASMNGLFLGYGAGPGYIKTYNSSDNLELYAHSGSAHVKMIELDAVNSNVNITGNITVSGSYNLASGDIPNNAADTSGNAATATALETARNIGGVSFDGTANINLPGVNTAGNQNTSGTAALATTVTVTDSNANTNFPIVFHDESNGLLDDTGALRYNPSTGTLLVPNLSVAGTTTQVNTVTMEAANAIVFEGATPDAYETTLTITDPTADRTITLPNASGTVAVSAGTGIDLSAAGAVSVDVSDFMANGADNRVLTATGTDTFRAEGGLTYDGSTLAVTGDLNVGSGDFFVDDSTGKVGIGTSGPTTPLHVSTTLTGNDATTLTGAEVFKVDSIDDGSSSNGPGFQIRLESTNDHNGANYEKTILGDGGGQKVKNIFGNYGFHEYWLAGNADGKKPIAYLTADGSTSASGTQYGKFRLLSTATAWGANTYNPSGETTALELNAGGDSYFNGGSVGIGTTSPSTELHVSGASHPSIRVTGTDNANADPAIELLGTADSFVEGGQMWYDNGTGVLHLASLYNNAAADIQFHTRTGADRSTSNVRMTIEGDGNVGIGTTSPAEKLHVAGNIRLNNNSAIKADGSGYMLLGNTSGGQIRLLGDASVSRIRGDANHLQLETARDSDDIIFAVNAGGTDSDDTVVEAMRIHGPDGNVGIGTSSPSTALEVSGTLTVGNAALESNQFRINNTGGYGQIELGGSSGAFIDLKNPFSDDYDLRLISSGTGGTIQTSGNANLGLNVGSGNVAITGGLTVSGSYNLANSDLPDLAVSDFAASAIVTESEGIGSNDNDTTLPTSAAVKDYVDNNAGSGDITAVVAGNGLTGGANSGSATLNIGAGTGIDVAADAISVDVSDFMTNGANNRILTATGTDGINAESNLTYDGTTLSVTASGTSTTLLLESTDAGNADAPILELHRNSSSPANGDDMGQILWSGEKSDSSKYSVTKMFAEINTVDNSDRLMINIASSGGSGLQDYEYIRFDGGVRDVIFNEFGYDIDVRIEGDSDSALFFTDASSDQIGIGTTSPQSKLHISSGTSGDAVLILEADTDNSDETDQPYIVFEQDGGVQHSAIGSFSGANTDNNALILSNSVDNSGVQAGIVFKTGTAAGYASATESMRIYPSGETQARKTRIETVSSNTTLGDDDSGKTVYWTGGTLTLPATAESGQQFVIINNTGAAATPGLGTSNSIASGWTSHASMEEQTARTYIAVAANTWIYIG